MTVFGQLVLGPPGSGKTKYCAVMHELLTGLGRRCLVVNLDPANDRLHYDCALNIFDLVSVADVMDNLKLGPNGALVHCMEFLEANIHWLVEGIKKACKSSSSSSNADHALPPYLLFDMPGQVELYTHHPSVRNIVRHLTTELDYRLCSVNLVDSYYVTDAAKFVSVLLMSLSSMLQLELPHVNILSKMDLIKQYGNLKFSLDFYTDVLDLGYLVEALEDEVDSAAPVASTSVGRNFSKKFKKLNEKIAELVQDYSLVSYLTLNIQRKSSVLRCVQQIDKANGYLFGHLDDQELVNAYVADVGGEDDEREDEDDGRRRGGDDDDEYMDNEDY